MDKEYQGNILDDRRVKVLNLLLQHHSIPDGDFNLRDLIAALPPDEYKKLTDDPEFAQLWKDVDMSQSLTRFMVDNGLANEHGDNLQLTEARGRDLKKQGSYGKLLEDERFITSEARRVNELELEADRMARRQYKINALIAFGTCVAALYYLLEILNGFFGFYRYHH